MKKPMIFLSLLSVLLFEPAIAFESVQGCFKATQSCEATRSIRGRNSPSQAFVQPGEEYQLIGKNKANAATHWQILFEGIQAPARWVDTSCGIIMDQCEGAPIPSTTRAISHDYLLAISWQPTFCESHRAKPECKAQHQQRFDATNFSLHGLWPQPRDNAYCGVNTRDKSVDRRKRWDLLAPLNLQPQVRQELQMVMPGYASYLQRHEWIKHGTCYGKAANDYYKDSLWMMRQVNSSAVRNLFKSRIGRTVNINEVRQSFDQSFGAGAGAKVNMRCDRKGRVAELWINLRGGIVTGMTFQRLLQQAPVARVDCQSGVVDPAGF